MQKNESEIESIRESSPFEDEPKVSNKPKINYIKKTSNEDSDDVRISLPREEVTLHELKESISVYKKSRFFIYSLIPLICLIAVLITLTVFLIRNPNDQFYRNAFYAILGIIVPGPLSFKPKRQKTRFEN